jgi:hypothetical protein
VEVDVTTFWYAFFGALVGSLPVTIWFALSMMGRRHREEDARHQRGWRIRRRRRRLDQTPGLGP